MKRELKFRSWCDYGAGHRTMLYDRGDLAEFFDASVGDEIMQYVWIKDKSGKEIYEGDILRSNKGKRFLVQWSNTKHRWGLLAQYYVKGWDYPMWKSLQWGVENCVVVGNKYQNPEWLLKNEK